MTDYLFNFKIGKYEFGTINNLCGGIFILIKNKKLWKKNLI